MLLYGNANAKMAHEEEESIAEVLDFSCLANIHASSRDATFIH